MLLKAGLICAFRLWNEDLEISVSTRENEKFRDNIISLGTTSMSAGFKTNPCGYVVDPESLEQFETSDERSAAEIAAVISIPGMSRFIKTGIKYIRYECNRYFFTLQPPDDGS